MILRTRLSPDTADTTSLRPRSGRLGLSCLLFLYGLCVRPGWSQKGLPEFAFDGFYPIGDYVLEIAGEGVPAAQFYKADHIPAVLVLIPEQASPVMLLPRSGVVESYPDGVLNKQPDGRVDLEANSRIEQGEFKVLASWVVFSVDGREWTLKQSPWLLGVQEVDSMLSYNPEYVWRSKNYVPDREVIEELRTQTGDVKVRVFFGSWCSFCKQQVPLMLKVATELASSPIQIDFYGLPQGFGRHPVAAPLKVTAVPTGIVRVNGNEVGRITGNQWWSPEVALKQILQQKGSAQE